MRNPEEEEKYEKGNRTYKSTNTETHLRPGPSLHCYHVSVFSLIAGTIHLISIYRFTCVKLCTFFLSED